MITEKLNALSAEARQKFNAIKPRTLGQASRISGVNPSDIQILMVYMGKKKMYDACLNARASTLHSMNS